METLQIIAIPIAVFLVFFGKKLMEIIYEIFSILKEGAWNRKNKKKCCICDSELKGYIYFDYDTEKGTKRVHISITVEDKTEDEE
jgi:hypothetical protein